MYEVKITFRTSWEPQDLKIKEFKTADRKKVLAEIRRVVGGYFLVEIDIWDQEKIHGQDKSST